jgi:ATP-binding cassette, subfamily C, bacteriocin exporter
MRKKTRIKQRDASDCGAACLASVASYYGLEMPISQIRQLAGTDKNGTNALGIVEAATSLGFSAKGVKAEIDILPYLPVPTIAHVTINKLKHYVVIYKTSRKRITVMDPRNGEIVKYSISSFEEIWTRVLILLTPSEMFEIRNEKKSVWKRFLFLLKPHRSIIIQSTIGAAFFTILGLFNAIYIQKIVDFVLPSGNRNLLNLLSSGMILIICIQLLVSIFKSIMLLKIGQQIDAKLILGYFRHLMVLPQGFFDTMKNGEIISRINDALKIRVFLNEVGTDILINCFVVIFSFILMFSYYWKLAIITLIIIPLYLLTYLISNWLNKSTERKVMENTAELEAQLIESLNGIRTIKYFGIQETINLKIENRFIKVLTSTYKSGINNIFIGNISMFISGIFTIILLWVGANLVLDGSITTGELMSFYAIIGYFTAPVDSLIEANKLYQNALIAADRLFEIFDLTRIDEECNVEIMSSDIGEIQLKNIKFRYGKRKEIFKEFNLTIPHGELTAIVGVSGSGKSTLASLIRRIHLPDAGEIMIGDYNLRHIKEESLSRVIAIVPQQIDLFSGSILENIALGDFNPDIQKIISQAKEIGALDFINELPEGLNFILSENGSNLSGGQKQRLAILRAIYVDPQIVIFDEASSSLDRTSEMLLTKIMLKLKNEGKTVINITHKLHSVVNSNKIVVLNNGKIEDLGTHEELVNGTSYYANFWKNH